MSLTRRKIQQLLRRLLFCLIDRRTCAGAYFKQPGDRVVNHGLTWRPSRFSCPVALRGARRAHMRDVAIGALLGAVLAVFVHLAAIHSRTHHDAHHATSAIHQALKRAPAAEGVSCPFLKAARPHKRARGTSSSGRGRGSRGAGTTRPCHLPVTGPRLRGDRAGGRRRFRKVRAGRGRERRACSYVEGRVRLRATPRRLRAAAY